MDVKYNKYLLAIINNIHVFIIKNFGHIICFIRIDRINTFRRFFTFKKKSMNQRKFLYFLGLLVNVVSRNYFTV